MASLLAFALVDGIPNGNRQGRALCDLLATQRCMNIREEVFDLSSPWKSASARYRPAHLRL